MKISMTNKKPILDDKLGRLVHGAVVDLPEHKARFFLERGEAEMYETKVVRESPYVVAGATEPLSALPVALVLPEQTQSESSNGEKTRGRPKKKG